MVQILLFALPGLLLGFGIYELLDDSNGDNGDETLTGDDQANNIDGKNGNDLISGLGGDDNLEGGTGNDVIDGGTGDDVVLAQQNNDRVEGGEGDDFLLGGQGNDSVSGDAGDDWVEGETGDDTLEGGSGDDLVLGGAGVDNLSGDEGEDLLFGGTIAGTPLNLTDLGALRDGTPLADLLDTTADSEAVLRDDGETDRLDGGAGDDLLVLGAGDTGIGGQGQDTFAVLFDQADGAEAGPALISDLTEDDALVLLTRDDTMPEITVSVENQDAVISANGEIVARVTGAGATLTADAITIIPVPTIADLDPNTDLEPVQDEL